jgi:acyl-CoA synthetase (AMP-forming)/AMP-acid ligase II
MHFNFAETLCRKHTDAIYRIAFEETRCAGINTYTYGGLDYLSDKFANTLQASGISAGEVVAAVLQPSAAFLVAHLGILKLGAIVAPFPTQGTAKFLKQALQESLSRTLVIDESFAKRFKEVLDELKNANIFIATDYVSKIEFENEAKGFWYEINFADADFKIACTDETTSAYYFFEQSANRKLKTTVLTHEALRSATQNFSSRKNNHPDEKSAVQPSENWASMNVLLEEVYPLLYQGQSISA